MDDDPVEERTAAGGLPAFPVGGAVTDDELNYDLHATLHRLRAAEPVSWLPALNGWLVTDYNLAVNVLRDAERFTVEDPRFSTGRVVGPSMLSTDGDLHTAHREPFEPMFRRGPVADAATGVTSAADQLLDNIAHGNQVELRTRFAAPLAVKVITDFLGLTAMSDQPESAYERDLLACYQDIVAEVSVLTPDREVGPSAMVAFGRLKSLLLDKVPADNLLQTDDQGSLLPLAGILQSGSMSADEWVSNVAVILFGAIETSEAMTANALLHVLGAADVQSRLLVDDTTPQVEGRHAVLRRAVVESLRLEPAAAVVDRYATADSSLGGVRIAGGDLIVVSLAGANRDPSIFDEPDEFRLDRPNAARQLAFARGPHTCIGIHLAMLQTVEALDRLLTRFPTARLDIERSTSPCGLVFRKAASVVASW